MGLKNQNGIRKNAGKLKWHLVDYSSLESMVRVLEFGAEKYDSWNWTKGLSVTEMCESLMRHTFAFMQGEDLDPETQLSHMGHVMCNAMFIEHMMKYRPDMDDRYSKEQFGKIVETFGDLDEFKALKAAVEEEEKEQGIVTHVAKPVRINAIEFTGATTDFFKLAEWLKKNVHRDHYIVTKFTDGVQVNVKPTSSREFIEIKPGYYIIAEDEGFNGAYPCNPKIFKKKYKQL